MAQPQEFEQVTYNAPDGAQIGRTSTEKVAFYGSTPAAKISVVATVDVSTTSSQSTSSGTGIGFGFTSLAEFQNTQVAVSSMQAALKALGIIA